jgi:hypothetical protein
MNIQKNGFVNDENRKPHSSSTHLFEMEKKNINVIVYCGYEGIDGLVFASTDAKETKIKILQLKAEATARKTEADKYTKDQRDEMLESEDPEVQKEYDRIFFGEKEPDRYCVMTYKDDEFKCSCNELGVSPKESWLY